MTEGTSEDVVLSVVSPVFDEAPILEALIDRCLAAARAVTPRHELVLVDDASRDETPARFAARAKEPAFRGVRLSRNAGQFRATQEGLRRARGAIVVVLDGDLQDPPEEIPRLVAALEAHADPHAVAFAVKTRRDDPLWLRAGAAGFHALRSAIEGGRVPPGAGSYCAMRRTTAQRVASLDLDRVNLAAALGAVGVVGVSVPYRKAARYDGRSRVGLVGLVREALGSLALSLRTRARLRAARRKTPDAP